MEQELRALGVQPAERGARTDEYLAAMRLLWDEPTPRFDGRFVAFADVIQRPRPVQRPHPPIVVGGHSAASYRRAVQSGNGWYGWGLTVEQTAATLAELAETAKRYERPAALGDLEITISPPGPVGLDTARRYADVGVHRLTLQPQHADPRAMEELITTAGETLIGRI
jgi:alkanesulfonate monooxygenase SsuD/methylene tetrahydromethanopterin reductase-like flavin-dependent oxidoreductase (luciferase family)